MQQWNEKTHHWQWSATSDAPAPFSSEFTVWKHDCLLTRMKSRVNMTQIRWFSLEERRPAACILHPPFKTFQPGLKNGNNMGYADLQLWNSHQPASHLWSRWKQFSRRSIVKAPCSIFLAALTPHQCLQEKAWIRETKPLRLRQHLKPKQNRASLQPYIDLTGLQSSSRISSYGTWQLNYALHASGFVF